MVLARVVPAEGAALPARQELLAQMGPLVRQAPRVLLVRAVAAERLVLQAHRAPQVQRVLPALPVLLARAVQQRSMPGLTLQTPRKKSSFARGGGLTRGPHARGITVASAEECQPRSGTSGCDLGSHRAFGARMRSGADGAFAARTGQQPTVSLPF
jgi:hypothetical protein